MKITFIYSCSGMFRHVPACSGMFRNVPCSGFYRRLEREQIRQILLDLEQLTSDTSFKLENMFLKFLKNEIFGSRSGPVAIKSR